MVGYWLNIFFAFFMDRGKVEVRGVASQRICRPGATNFWFDHSTAVMNYVLLASAKKFLSVW